MINYIIIVLLNLLTFLFANCFACFQYNQGVAGDEWRGVEAKPQPGTHLAVTLNKFKLILLDCLLPSHGATERVISSWEGKTGQVRLLYQIYTVPVNKSTANYM